MHVLELTSVRRTFGGVVAVDDVSLTVDAGEVLGVIGPNGSGKTTVVNLVTRVIPLEAGTMRFYGAPFDRMQQEALIDVGLARTFQNLRLFEDLTVRENVALVTARSVSRRRRFVPASERVIRRAADDLLDKFGITHLSGRLPKELPYGDQRRVEIARALAARPKLLLLDEPFAGMATGEADDVCAVLRQAQSDLNLTLVIVDHNMDTLADMCSRFVAMARGRVIAEGPPHDVLADAEVVKAYVGEP